MDANNHHKREAVEIAQVIAAFYASLIENEVPHPIAADILFMWLRSWLVPDD